MIKNEPSKEEQNRFIWKDPLPCIVDFGYELRRIGLTKVLDIGCRVGNNSIALAKLGLEVTAIDSSSSYLDILQGRSFNENVNVNTIKIENDTLPFEDNSISAIVTTTAIHHLTPQNSRKLVQEMHRVLIPGGRILVSVLSIKDYRYGTGTKIDDNTYENTVGPELKNIHQFFTSDTLKELFSGFEPESEPHSVLSTFSYCSKSVSKQGSLLIGKFLKKPFLEKQLPSNSLLSDLNKAKRSVELLFSYPNINGDHFTDICTTFLNSISDDFLNRVYIQCVIIGNNLVDSSVLIDKLKKHEGNEHISLAYLKQNNMAHPLCIAIIDGEKCYCSANLDSQNNSVLAEISPKLVNFFRVQLNSHWNKSTVLIDYGQKIKNNNYLDPSGYISVLSDSEIRIIDLAEKRKEVVRIGISQIDLNGLLHSDVDYLLKPDTTKIQTTIEHTLISAASQNIDIVVLPELSGDRSLNEKLQMISNKYNMIIVGGSYYDTRRINCCPVAIPGMIEPFIIEKIHPAPVELSPTKDTGIVGGKNNIIFKNTSAGTFGVVICSDFLNDELLENILLNEIDFLCIVSMNNDSPRFHEKMNLKCKNSQRGIYILYSNCLFSTSGFKTDGMSSLFGFMDRLYLSKLNRKNIKHEYQIASFYEDESEGLIIADININERRPKIISPSTKPNIFNIEKVSFSKEK